MHNLTQSIAKICFQLPFLFALAACANLHAASFAFHLVSFNGVSWLNVIYCSPIILKHCLACWMVIYPYPLWLATLDLKRPFDWSATFIFHLVFLLSTSIFSDRHHILSTFTLIFHIQNRGCIDKSANMFTSWHCKMKIVRWLRKQPKCTWKYFGVDETNSELMPKKLN